jgi:hypothetical protein
MKNGECFFIFNVTILSGQSAATANGTAVADFPVKVGGDAKLLQIPQFLQMQNWIFADFALFTP